MSARRSSRRPATAASDGVLPYSLLIGPCVEVWAPEDPDPIEAAHTAQHAWWKALKEWALANGVNAWEARDLARTKTPWSRAYLEAHGRGHQADRYEYGDA